MKVHALARTRTSAPLRLAALLLAVLWPAALLGAAQESEGQEPTLSESTHVGRILDREGNAARRPVMGDRWGPAEARGFVAPGDWLRTGSRGANALAVRLAGGADVVLGPAGLVEVAEGDELKLVRGELRADVPDGRTLSVSGPGATTIAIQGRAVLRARDGKLVRLDEDPRWLTGYENDASTEALGSLLANVDGRNVPLTIGYHNVTVDVRDQIARTVIEESFVNHTDSILEGVFYFPLPADASISGFAMWINGEQVPGEIVEKQRAREIYETILRERRDPGLLEWTGGNIFKARVFPIGAEKRIKISYTQVLPKDGDTFSYHYALSSELLRKNPLRELRIEVTVASSEPIAEVTCPSHDCRIRTTETSARVEFDAEEFAPDRDFELRVRTNGDGAGLVAVPHRRGDDGYFMMLVDAPPAPAGATTDGAPIDLLVLADTSGSTHGPARDHQVRFVEALLGTLGENDTFDLATCDTETRWAFDGSTDNLSDARERALRFLEAREPLGWSNLDAAFASVAERLRPNTHVVYVGDGAPTSGAADPVALAQELERRYQGVGTFHAVVPGSRSEMTLLRALAGLGGGSVRAIGGGTDPAATAFRLAREMTAPALKDLELTFEGVEVAAVYPERLPNVAAGGQQIVVGRFDPTGGATSGRVTLTGTFAGKTISRTTDVSLAENEEGNSFIPRLWARKHLDHLLAQGRSKEVKERIVGLSEDFQIITPYTSFLVLESDEDRERFRVKKAFRMRDGEEFFAEGRADAVHELVREQIKRAKGWRRGLRAEALATLAGMNRDLTELLRPGGRPIYPQSGSAAFGFDSRNEWFAYEKNANMRSLDYLSRERAAGEWKEDDGETLGEDEGWTEEEEWEGDPDAFGDASEPMAAQESLAFDGPFAPSTVTATRAPARKRALRSNALYFEQPRAQARASSAMSLSALGYAGGGFSRPMGGLYPHDGFANLFPSPYGSRGDEPTWTWSDDVLQVVRSLDRRQAIDDLDGGVAITTTRTDFDERGRATRATGRHVVGPDAWVVGAQHTIGSVYPLQWWANGERGIAQVGWWLGRTREAQDGESDDWGAPFRWHFGDAMRNHAGYDAALEELEGGRVKLTLTRDANPGGVFDLVIDRARAVVLETTWTVDGVLENRTVFGGFREVAGAWWPSTIEHFVKDRETPRQRTTIEVQALDAEAFDARIAAELEPKSRSILLGEEPEDLAAAKQSVKDGEGDVDSHLFLLRWFARSQRWDRARPHLDAIAEQHAGKPGLVALSLAYLQRRRRNEELRTELLTFAADLAANPRDGEHGLATHALGYTSSLGTGQEQLAFLEAIRPVIERQTAIIDPALSWDRAALYALQVMGRSGAAVEKLAQMIEAYPYAVDVHVKYANQLATDGRVDDALAHLERAETELGPWQQYEVGQFLRTGSQILWNSYRLEDFVRRVEAWERETPERLDQNLVAQFLSAYVYLDREDEAWERAERWMREYRKEELENHEVARLLAATSLALGQGYNLYSYRFDDSRADLLGETARAFAKLDQTRGVVYQIVTNHNFRRTDVARDVNVELFAALSEGLATMKPAHIERHVQWLRGAGYTPDDEPEAWTRIVEAIHDRWTRAEEKEDREILARVLIGQGDGEMKARVYRRQIELAESEAERVFAVQLLFGTLLTMDWTAEREAELIGLVAAMQLGGDDPAEAALESNLVTRILALHDLTSWMPRARARAAVQAMPDVNLMTRRKLASVRSDALREARRAASESLAAMAAATTPAALAEWVAIERTYLDLKTKSGLANARTSSLERLETLVARHAETAADEVPLRDRVLAARCAATYSFLLSRYEDGERSEHEPAFTSLVDANIDDDRLLDWKQTRYTLLLALDRVAEIEASLTAWYGGGEEFAKVRWGRDLAYVALERSDLERAAALFVEIEQFDELTHDDYRALADVYTALDRQEDAREAKIASWEVLGEYEIGNRLRNESGNVQRRFNDGVPVEMDPEVPLRFIALMRKSTSPSQWVYALDNWYRPTKDFRLLECLPDAVLGRSAEQIYGFLGSIGNLTTMIQEEAVVDRLRAQLDVLYAAAETDVDRRALRLLEFVTVQNALRQANGIEDHVRIAARALRESAKGEWTDGEPRLMASFLESVGALQPAELGDEQLRILRELRGATADRDDRLAIATSYARVLWMGGRGDDAIRALEGAVAVFRGSSDAPLPNTANDALATLGSWHESQGSYAKAESLWLDELELVDSEQQRLWLRRNLLGSYRNAVLRGGTVSLGEGEALYRAVSDLVVEELAQRTNENHASNVVRIATDLWRRAHGDLKLTAAGEDATLFAFRGLPRVLDHYQYRGGQNMVGNVADCLKATRNLFTTLEFLTVRAENEPSWLRLQNQDFWSQHSWRFGDIRRRAGALPEALDQRVLAVVLAELREDLRTRQARSRAMYDVRYGDFWKEKRDDFRRATLEFLREPGRTGSSIVYATDYLFRGLEGHDEAIAALQGALRRGVLDVGGRFQLAVFLHERSRWEESVELLVDLVADRPGRVDVRVMLMTAYFQTSRTEALVETYDAAVQWLRENDRWDETAIAAIAQGCLNTRLLSQAVEHYDEAIALHVKSAPNRGVGDGVLSQYYRTQSSAYAQLGRTDEAVDAAAGAIVSWGSNIEQRSWDLQNLTNVLASAEDLDAYIARLDASNAETGLENPIVRKALGTALLGKERWADAARELRRALDAQPGDLEIYPLLLRAHDGAKDRDGYDATKLEWALAAETDLNLWRDLGHRLETFGHTARAERVRTQMVELMPNESESHAALAEIRQKQDLWDAAVDEWRHVVRIRTNEAPGYVALARALIHLDRKGDAQEVVDHLLATEWHERFGDVHETARGLQRRIRWPN